jgi:hypothetical protein
MKNKITQIVLLGGGYVSIWAYRSLLKKLRHEISSGDVRIMRWFFFNYYMPSKKVMFREIADWMHLLFSGRRKAICLQDKRTETVIGSMLIPSSDPSSSRLPRGKVRSLMSRPVFIS